MKIYFAGSIRGGRSDAVVYKQIIKILAAHGTVLTEHVGNEDLSPVGEKEQSDRFIYGRDMKWANSADVVVAEVTVPSHGVGYELGRFEGRNIPILCLYRPNKSSKLSAMIAGNPNFVVKRYRKVSEAKSIVQTFFQKLF